MIWSCGHEHPSRQAAIACRDGQPVVSIGYKLIEPVPDPVAAQKQRAAQLREIWDRQALGQRLKPGVSPYIETGL